MEASTYEDKWLVAAYAAKQPNGNTLWASIVEQMLREAMNYLACIDIIRS